MDQDHGPQESGCPISPWLASAAAVSGPALTAGSAWRKGHREGRFLRAALTLEAPQGLQPLGQWRKGGDGVSYRCGFFPQGMGES